MSPNLIEEARDILIASPLFETLSKQEQSDEIKHIAGLFAESRGISAED